MKSPTLLSMVLLISISTASANELIVGIPSEGVTLEYTNPVRLEQVIQDADKVASSRSPLTFSVSNQLFDVKKEDEANQLKLSILQQLIQLSQSTPKLRTSIDLLITQIKLWDVGYRVINSLDYDVVRLSTSQNPLLSGHFELLLPKRQELFYVEGLVFSPQTIAIDNSYSISEHLNNINTLSSANKSEAWVVYPDGHFISVGYAHWNEQQVTNITPGTIVFFGFNSDRHDIQELEQQIIKLITMRKGL